MMGVHFVRVDWRIGILMHGSNRYGLRCILSGNFARHLGFLIARAFFIRFRWFYEVRDTRQETTVVGVILLLTLFGLVAVFILARETNWFQCFVVFKGFVVRLELKKKNGNVLLMFDSQNYLFVWSFAHIPALFLDIFFLICPL